MAGSSFRHGLMWRRCCHLRRYCRHFLAVTHGTSTDMAWTRRERTHAEAAVGFCNDEHANVAALRAGALVRLQLADDHAERLGAVAGEVAQLWPLL